jgi:S1-C subfamily serine protease
MRNHIKSHTAILAGLTVTTFLLAACITSQPDIQEALPTLSSPAAPATTTSRAAEDLQKEQETLVAIYEHTAPGVAAISVYADGSVVGQGSAFLIDHEGHLLTNFHVVEGATEIELAFPSGMRLPSQVIGTDLDSDIAVLKVELPDDTIQPLPLGDSASVKVGQSVLAIGNPFGLSGTMTQGIVSARGRLLESMRTAPSGGYFTAPDLIQTDAAINPGNSGGPLLNLSGEVIGINRAIRTDDGDGLLSAVNSGIGFAVPIDIAKRVVPYLIRDGEYAYPYLGIVSREDLSLAEREALGLAPGVIGAYVVSVPEGGPAAKAGMRGGSTPTRFDGLPAGGDLITSVDGQPIRAFSDLLAYLVAYKTPGDELVLGILRNSKELTLTVTLTSRSE